MDNMFLQHLVALIYIGNRSQCYTSKFMYILPNDEIEFSFVFDII